MGREDVLPVGCNLEAIEFNIQWVLSVGLLPQSKLLKERLEQLSHFRYYFENEYGKSVFVMSFSPLIRGNINLIQDCITTLNNFINFKCDINTLVSSFVFPRIDELCKFRRNQIEEVIFLDRLLSKSTKRIGLIDYSYTSLNEALRIFRKDLSDLETKVNTLKLRLLLSEVLSPAPDGLYHMW
jgi:hypothetical protein